jgi:hypothetical protein
MSQLDNLSKRNVKLILKVLSDLDPLRGSSNKKTLNSTRSCVNWAFFGTRTNSLNKLLFYTFFNNVFNNDKFFETGTAADPEMHLKLSFG